MSHTEISETFSRYSEEQKLAIVFAPIIPGCLSILASGYLIYTVLKDKKRGIWRVHERILMIMSIFDIIFSLNSALSSIPVPKDVPLIFASGNNASCVLSAFINQFGLIVAYYNTTLCWYFFLVINKNMKEAQIKKREWIIHGVPFVMASLSGFVPLAQDMYRYEGTTRCWIASFPLGCHVNDDIDCIAAENALSVAWVYAGMPILVVFAFVSVTMILIYIKVYRMEKKNMRIPAKADLEHSSSNVDKICDENKEVNDSSNDMYLDEIKPDECRELEQDKNASLEDVSTQSIEKMSPEMKPKKAYKSKSRVVAKIALLYVLALFATYIFLYVRRTVRIKDINTFFVIHFLDRVFFPTHGIFNLGVFMYRRKVN